jgi:hypothetical protein
VRRVTQNTFRPVGLCLPHSGVEGSPKTLLGRWGSVYLIPASTATNNTSGPVGLCLSHSGVEESPKTLLGRSGCVYLIPASKATNNIWAGRAVSISLRRRRVTQTTSRPVGLCLFHSGVEGLPKSLLGRWGCVYLIPASTATNNISGPVGLR